MKQFLRAAALAASCLYAATASAAEAADTAPVQVSGGAIAGTQTGALRTYLGIPYAAPPVGALRWAAPQPVTPWQGVRAARQLSAACAQTAVWITMPKSEDCLYLNVWAPADAKDSPVIVWLHGGGYYGGSGGQALFDGANLARRGAVVVTVNYRLGILGFFAHPELTAESPQHASGNQGILDQIAALRWVHDNIAAFGGDPRHVAIAGESAGGETVAIMLASPLAKGLFQGAIAESGGDGFPRQPQDDRRFSQQAAEAAGQAYARAAGAPRLADLRKLSVAALHQVAWTPRTNVDGYVLREDLTSTYRAHRQNDVPLLVGWNAEEGKDLAPEILNTTDFSAARYRALATQLLGRAPSPALLAAYPGDTDAQARASLIRLTDDWWGWRMVRWADVHAANGRSATYAYYFAHQPTAPVTPCTYGCGAGHTAEIRYVFDNLGQDKRPWSEADRQLAGRMADSWINFARSGSPNGPGLPAWPRYDGSKASILRIGNDKSHDIPDFSLF